MCWCWCEKMWMNMCLCECQCLAASWPHCAHCALCCSLQHSYNQVWYFYELRLSAHAPSHEHQHVHGRVSLYVRDRGADSCYHCTFLCTHSSQERLEFVNKPNGASSCCKSFVVLYCCEITLRVFCSVPDEGLASEDRSAPPSPEDRDGGLFLLKKDSERRAILYKVLNEDQEKVISNLLENHIQVCVRLSGFLEPLLRWDRFH